ncbi:MAG: tetratricopeptide repeat protein [Duncaniella sp.]|nr:tetratricopeptide repeat protein [Duncaniella sp.]
MKKAIFLTLTALMAAGGLCGAQTAPADSVHVNIKTDERKSRNFTVEGNKAFREENYAAAEVAYRKAIDQNNNNDVAKFNLAAALLRQRSTADTEAAEAYSLLSQIAHSELSEESLVEKSFYNLGNLAFNKQQYAESIEHYKNALRRNPDNDKARENLYLAQKMLEQQQNQNQNQDQNKDQNQNQDQQDKNKDQQQDQNKDQNKDQNQDQNKDQNQDKQDQQQQQPQDKKEQPQQQQPGQISPENAQQILKAMENAENATRARIEKQNAEKSKANSSRRPVTNPW